jgi:putative membrane protein
VSEESSAAEAQRSQLAGPAVAPRRTALASERTQLAWWRTGLAALAVALGVGRVVPALANSGARWPYVVVGVAFASYGVVLIGYGTRRAREFARIVGNIGPGTDPMLGILTGAGVLLGLATAALILFG